MHPSSTATIERDDFLYMDNGVGVGVGKGWAIRHDITDSATGFLKTVFPTSQGLTLDFEQQDQ